MTNYYFKICTFMSCFKSHCGTWALRESLPLEACEELTCECPVFWNVGMKGEPSYLLLMGY